ncbi:MAG: glycoside hydrolase family 97 protein, partial [Bacteroidota bacterium]
MKNAGASSIVHVRVLLALFFAFGCVLPAVGQAIRIAAPNQSYTLTFSAKSGLLHYEVHANGLLVVRSAESLGFDFVDAPAFRDGLKMRLSEQSTHDSNWSSPTLSNGAIRNHYKEAKIEVRERGLQGRKMILIARAYDDGVAFKYVFPDGFASDSVFITNEHTSFRFGETDTAWWAHYNDFAYESLYRKSAIHQVGECATPITIKSETGIWLSIHEAALIDYSELFLKPIDGAPGSFAATLHPWPDGVSCRARGSYETPWRCILMESDAAGLLTSNLVRNLNAPPVLKDFSWVKPIRFTGIWWGMHLGKYTWYEGERHGATTERTKQYIDFAAANGVEGVLVEGWNKGWETWANNQTPLQDFTAPTSDFDLIKLSHYAKMKGVKLVGHHETGGNIPEYERQMEAAFEMYKSLGIRYVKTGYAGPILPQGMHHHGQYMVRHFQKVVELAAKHEICLNVHESIKPTGLDRTWPNLLTQEAVRGNEWNATYRSSPPSHSVILPFTRGVAGPFDFTPGIFNVNHSPEKNKRINTLLTHQLAQCVVFDSPMLMFADEQEHYANHPLLDVMKNIQAAWDSTVVLAANPESHLVLARKKEASWMVAGLAGDSAAYAEWLLGFLEPGKSYRARIIYDIPQGDILQAPMEFGDVTITVKSTDRIPCNMLPGGGFIMWITPADSIPINDASIQHFIESTDSYRNDFAIRKRYGTMRSTHQGIAKQVTYNIRYNQQYDGGGSNGLNDGMRGGLDYTSGGWQGFLGSGLDIT